MIQIKTPVCWLPLLFVALCAASTVRAEDGGEKTEKEYRYDFKVIDGKLVRVDRKNGSVEIVGGGSEETVKSAEPSGKPVELSISKPAKHHEPARNRPPAILEINGEACEVDDRDEARKDVALYGGEIGISQALQVDGERVSGLVRVTNNGGRRLEALELTLYIPTASNKTVEHRIMMSPNRKGSEAPPPPNKGGSALNRVDFSAPEVVKGQLEVRVTYLKFAGE